MIFAMKAKARTPTRVQVTVLAILTVNVMLGKLFPLAPLIALAEIVYVTLA